MEGESGNRTVPLSLSLVPTPPTSSSSSSGDSAFHSVWTRRSRHGWFPGTVGFAKKFSQDVFHRPPSGSGIEDAGEACGPAFQVPATGSAQFLGQQEGAPRRRALAPHQGLRCRLQDSTSRTGDDFVPGCVLDLICFHLASSGDPRSVDCRSCLLPASRSSPRT